MKTACITGMVWHVLSGQLDAIETWNLATPTRPERLIYGAGHQDQPR